MKNLRGKMVTVQPYKMIYNNGVVVLGEVFRLKNVV